MIESHDNQVVVHLIQSYPLRCPRCGQLMLKNGFKIVNVLGPSLHYQPTIWSMRNQKYLCKPSSACPSTITELAKVKDIKYRHHISQAIKQQVMIQLTTNGPKLISPRNWESLTGLLDLTWINFLNQTIIGYLAILPLMILNLVALHPVE